jgi:CRISPR/Cas system endoribonuclease Cas6 (RAMP superfamily)
MFDYLMSAFPTQLHEIYTDDEGEERSRPVVDEDGNPVHSQQALQQREELIERLALLPPVPSALDQIIHHFGHDKVADTIYSRADFGLT